LFCLCCALFLLPACGATINTAASSSSDADRELVTVESEPLLGNPQPLEWDFDVSHYDIALNLDIESRAFGGEVTLLGSARNDETSCIRLHAGESLNLAGPVLLGPVGPLNLEITNRVGDTFELCAAEAFQRGEQVAIRIGFTGVAEARNQYGIFTVPSETSELPMFFSQFETQGARRALPCYDEPFDKATTTVTLTADARYTLLSNGEPVGRTEQDGLATAVWNNSDPISPYLITVVAAELEQLEGEYVRDDGTSVALTVYTELGHRDDAGYALESLETALAHYEAEWGLAYPWDRYGIVALPGFTWGGMENKGLTNIGAAQVYWNDGMPTYRRYGVFGVVAHELAHEWFGNLITMQWWPDVWLNEGFATLLSSSASRAEFNRLGALMSEYVSLRRGYMRQESGPFAHAIVPDSYESIEILFDSVIYTKGRRVLEMLSALMGRDEFREGIRQYVSTFGEENADTAQFLGVLAEHTEIDLERYGNGWVRSAGFPIVTVTPEWDAGSGALTVTVSQESSGGGEGAWIFPLTIGLQSADYDTTESVVVDEATERFVFPLDGEPELISINREGVALIDYAVEGWTRDDWVRQAAEDSDAYNRGVAYYRLLEDVADEIEAREGQAGLYRLPTQVFDAMDALWSHDETAVRSFALAHATNTYWPELLRSSLSRHAVPYATAVLDAPRPEPLDMTEIGLVRQAIAVLGWADAEHAALEELTSSSEIDYVLTATQALLRTSSDNRYDVHEAVLQRYREEPRLARDLVTMLAAVPDPAIFDRLRAYLADPTLIAPADSRVPRAIFGALMRSNLDLAYSQPGMDFLLEAMTANLDRPGLLARGVRGFQNASERSPEDQERLRVMLGTLRDRALASDATAVVENIDSVVGALENGQSQDGAQ